MHPKNPGSHPEPRCGIFSPQTVLIVEEILNQVQDDVPTKGFSDARRATYFLGST